MERDDIRLWNAGEAKRSWLGLGCRYLREYGAHRFALWAPHARSVSVVGDWNGWDGCASPMARGENGLWTAFIPGLSDGAIYKYCIVGPDGGAVLKADPFAFHSETVRRQVQRSGASAGTLGGCRILSARRKGLRSFPHVMYEDAYRSWGKGLEKRDLS
jgi:1,4-alpha-glucan branching enzyme